MSTCHLARPIRVEWRPQKFKAIFDGWEFAEAPWNEPCLVEHYLGSVVAMAVDPGEHNGLALLPFDKSMPVLLADLSDTTLAETVLRTTGAAQMHLIVEQPLHGAKRVYDPMPWQMYGFLRHWHLAESSAPWGFVRQQVAALEAGSGLVRVRTNNVSVHSKDALYHLAVALHKHPEILEMIQ